MLATEVRRRRSVKNMGMERPREAIDRVRRRARPSFWARGAMVRLSELRKAQEEVWVEEGGRMKKRKR